MPGRHLKILYDMKAQARDVKYANSIAAFLYILLLVNPARFIRNFTSFT